jgi:hypothetical protein
MRQLHGELKQTSGSGEHAARTLDMILKTSESIIFSSLVAGSLPLAADST